MKRKIISGEVIKHINQLGNKSEKIRKSDCSILKKLCDSSSKKLQKNINCQDKEQWMKKEFDLDSIMALFLKE